MLYQQLTAPKSASQQPASTNASTGQSPATVQSQLPSTNSGWWSWLPKPAPIEATRPTLSVNLTTLLEIQNATPTDANLDIKRKIKGIALIEGFVLSKDDDYIQLGPSQSSPVSEGLSIYFNDDDKPKKYSLKVGQKVRMLVDVMPDQFHPIAPFRCSELAILK
jgi:hypothetical protein